MSWFESLNGLHPNSFKPPTQDEFSIEFNYDQQLQTDIQQCVLSLQDETSRLDDKLHSLRTLHNYIEKCNSFADEEEKKEKEKEKLIQNGIETERETETETKTGREKGKPSVYSIDAFNRKRINQLIIDSILQIIIDEGANINPFRRQLIRVELYLLLSKLLQSNALFGSELTKTTLMKIDEIANPNKLTSSPSKKNMLKFQKRSSSVPVLETEDSRDSPSKTQTPSRSEAPSRGQMRSNFPSGSPSPRSSKRTSTRNTHRVSFSDEMELDLSNNSTKEITLLQPILSAEKKKVHLYSKLKPRPSVLFNDKMQTDSFVPGADPNNFFEQDRKLGYQKPRMWFPTPQLEVANGLINDKTTGNSSQVVEEYLRMKALASYVGDLVIPSAGLNNTSSSAYDTILLGKKAGMTLKNKYNHVPAKNITDPVKYAHALREAMQLWSPILGVHKPQFGKKRSFDLYLGEDNEERREESGSHSKLKRVFYEESVMLPAPPDQYGLIPHKRPIMTLHEEMNQRFQDESSKTAQELQSIGSKIDRIIARQYKSFQPKFILILEGDQARQRKLLTRMTSIFIKHKRRNWLAIAFGIWSIQLVEARSLAKRPMYASVASCHLMLNWLVKSRQRNFKMWLQRWKRTVTWLIFAERAKAVVIVQKHFRRMQARERMVRMHFAGKYLGVLSDIKLGITRHKLRYKIPQVIRDDRRMYWLAARMIQTLFRCWIECKEYFKKKRQLILLQSICRMWPKLCKFRRLKAVTIRCQAWVRRTLQRRKYVKLRLATLVVQKYVRRYLSILWKTRTLFSEWSIPEREMDAAIKIQCRYRIRLAKRVTKAKRFAVLKIEWAALVVQRNWYKHKKAFHTFFLMCALRERERQDLEMEKLATKMGRYQCARRIQRVYKLRYIWRIVENAIKIQCWYRGRIGYLRSNMLRKIWWASRKLHHWAKVRVRRWQRLARKIQRWWWRLKEKRLLKHLWYLAAKQEKERLRAIKMRRYNAAARIQAHVKGIWDRRWAKRHRAAKIIQRNFRFFNGLRKWKNWKREGVLKDVRKFVNKVLERAVSKRVKELVARHSKMLIKPQALIRGFVVRSIMFRVKTYARKLANAVIIIQRFWRKIVAMTKAVEEVMAKRRMEANPFKKCLTLHEILLIGRRVCHPYFSFLDPRVGMKISTFLYRLGLIHLLDVFQRKDLVFVSDLASLTVDKMVDLYNIAQKKRNSQKDKKQQQQQQQQEDPRNKKSKNPPMSSFQLILDFAKIPFYPKFAKDRDLLQLLLCPFPEHYAASQCYEIIRKKFLKRFGKNLQSRANNVARDVMDSSWKNYNNYRGFGELITGGHIDRALTATQESNQFLTVLDEIRTNRPYKISDERKWDIERLKTCSNLMQMAVDKALTLLPSGSFRTKLEKVVSRIASYRRKCNYILQKRQRQSRTSTPATNKKDGASGASGQATTANESKFNSADDDSVNSQVISADKINVLITPEESLELSFDGSDEDLELEVHASICKVYMDIMERWCIMSTAVQSLKNTWSNKALSRAFLNEKRKQYLNAATKAYIKEQNTDHVKAVWLKFKKKGVMDKKLSLIYEAIAKRKEFIDSMLQYVPRYHIQTDYDAVGFPFYIDEHGEATYDMPIYSYKQWLAMLTIQKQARKYLVVLQDRKIKRLEMERIALALAEEKLLEERKKALKGVDVTLVVTEESIERGQLERKSGAVVNTNSNKKEKVVDIQLERDVEMMLPWKYQFDYNLPYTNGIWAILFTATGKDKIIQVRTGVYEVVIVFRIRLAEELCDIRSVKGKITKDVSLTRLRQMNYDLDTIVECRYKYRKMFYRGKIIKVDSTTDYTSVRYGIQYDDGECEYGIERDAIRPTVKFLLQWQEERNILATEAKFVKRRQLHFEKLKRQRMKSYFKLPKIALTLSAAPEIGKNPVPSVKVLDSLDENEAVGASGGEGLIFVPDPVEEDPVQPSRRDRLRTISFDVDTIDAQPIRRERLRTLSVEDDVGEDGKSAANKERRQSRQVGSTSKEIKRPILRVKLRICRAALQYNWIIITPESDSFDAQLVTQDDDIEEVSLVEQLRRQRYNERMMEQRKHKTISLANVPPEDLVFYNTATQEERGIDDIPLYSIPQIFLIQKLQLRWNMFKALKLVKKRIHCLPLLDMMEKTVKQGMSIGYIGYNLEGLTPFQLLVRAGYFELADIIKDHLMAMQKSLTSISLEDIAEKAKDDYEVLGVVQTNHVRDLKEFQTWWKKTLPYEREKKLALFNYYSSPDDPRFIQDCVQESVELMLKKFTRVVKASQTKTKAACQSLVEQSMFPHSHQQVETYLKRYADKPELARESIMDLLNKPTTHTYVEESKVFKIFKHTALRVSAALRLFRLEKMHSKVADAIKRSERMMTTVANIRSVQDSSAKSGVRPLCSGPEAKAAWILRQDVFQYMIEIIKATIRVQRRVKTFLSNKKWKGFLAKRKQAVDLIQRSARRYFAYRVAKYLRAQRDSPWEQLWSNQYNVLYYYNYMTGESQYEEPYDYSLDDKNSAVAIAAPFRPLIRDRGSAALMQAWPFLDEEETRRYYRSLFSRTLPVASSHMLDNIPEQLLCVICKTRKCVRYCLDCDYVKLSASKSSKMSASSVYGTTTSLSAKASPFASLSTTPYCLTCYSKEHSDDNEEKSQHRFQVVGMGLKDSTGDGVTATQELGAEGKLLCSQCNELASRKCLGPFSDELIEEICVKLRRAHVDQWLNILKDEKVAGERKLLLLIEGIMKDTGGDSSSEFGTSTNMSGQLQSIRAVLEKCRAECDECYCTRCYQDLHSGGRRALHYWKGFLPGCQVCAVCHSTPAEWNCVDCDDEEYCDSCFKVFHNMGRKRRHKKNLLLEQSPEDDDESATRTNTTYCDFCTRKLGQYCSHCSQHPDDENTSAKTAVDPVICCEECFEFKHKYQCKGLRDMDGIKKRRRLEDVGVDGTGKVVDKYAISKTKKDYSLAPTAPPTLEELVCVVCHEPADKKCMECNDFYCSKVWMGNPGCFQKFHSKGNRATHTTEPVSRPALSSSVRSSKIGTSNNNNNNAKAIMSASLDSSHKLGLNRPPKPSGAKIK